jgi:hypothetical protein
MELDAPLSDFGDATADDVLSGKSFTSTDGYQRTGNISVAYGGIMADGTIVDKSYMRAIEVNYTVEEPTCISPQTGPDIGLTVFLDTFGDATAEDVAAGKTFTSASGFKTIGTSQGGTATLLRAEDYKF